MLTNEIDLELVAGGVLHFSVQDNELLFIHSDFISSQLPINQIGVMILHQGDSVSVAFSLIGSQAYQNWFVAKTEYRKAIDYFRTLGFPTPNPDPFHYEGIEKGTH